MTFLPTAYALNAKKGYHDGDADTNYVAATLEAHRGKGGGGLSPEETLVAAPLTKGSATGRGVNPPGRRQEDDVNLVAAFYPTGGTHGLHDYRDGTTPPMKVGTGVGAPAGMAVTVATGVRRLTPVECERLQGLPDDWTKLNAKTPDSRRYSALGDAVTANVAEWIGRRLVAHGPAAGDGQP